MARQFSMPYQLPPVSLLAPAADAAGRTSSYRSLKNALKAYVVVEINQGNAATVALTLMQAKDVSGTSAIAMTATPIWLNDATATSDALVAQVAAAGFTTDANVADKIVIFEIEPEACMSVGSGYKTIAVTTGASNAANITSARLYYLPSYVGASAPSTYV